jgi:hypothetical protein
MIRPLALFALLVWFGSLALAAEPARPPSPLTLAAVARDGGVAEWLRARPRRPLAGWPCVRSAGAADSAGSRQAIAAVLRQVEAGTGGPFDVATIEAWIELRDAALDSGCYANWVAADQLHRVAALGWAAALASAKLAPPPGAVPGRGTLERLAREVFTSERAEHLFAAEAGSAAPQTGDPAGNPERAARATQTERERLLQVLEKHLGDLGKALYPSDPEPLGAYALLERNDPAALVQRIISTDELRLGLLPYLVLAAEGPAGSEAERLRAGALGFESLQGIPSPLLRRAGGLHGAEALLADLRQGGKGDLLFFDNSREAWQRRGLAAATIRWVHVGGAETALAPLVLAIEIENPLGRGLLVSHPAWQGSEPAVVEVAVTSPAGELRRARVEATGPDSQGAQLARVPGGQTLRLVLTVGWRADATGGPLFDVAGTYRVQARYRPLVLGAGAGRHVDPAEVRESEPWTVQVAALPPRAAAERSAGEPR